jgi:hypothetical protein
LSVAALFAGSKVIFTKITVPPIIAVSTVFGGTNEA